MSGVCIIYPTDPFGGLPGGIDTFIDGLIRWSPDDVELRLLGISTDPRERPVGQWNDCSLGGRSFQFYPVLAHAGGGRRPVIPMALHFMLALLRRRPKVMAEILEFHRIEPMLMFLRDPRPKTCFMHQNMAELRNERSDIRWRYAPHLYTLLERLLIPRLTRSFCVREDAVQAYREKYPRYRERFQFTPTWVDHTLFSPPSREMRQQLRRTLSESLGFGIADELLVFVGRLDHQKDPLLLLRAFAGLRQRRPSARLIVIGAGVLRGDVERLISAEGLSGAVALIGLQRKSAIADWLRAADLFVLSSAYEGMPMAVLEALGCGLPVLSTDVGEVKRVVKSGVNGEIVASRDARELASAMDRCLSRREAYAGSPCTTAVAAYTADKVVARIYDYYRGFLSGREEGARPALRGS
jgi:glycosyltransferase involved in cell wall biosynthesis